MTKKKKTGIILLGVASLFSLALLLWQSQKSPSFETKEAVPENKEFAQAQRLAGQWVRLDGGYRLIIEDVKPDGSLKASYFNPSAIHVHEANWEVKENITHLFIELRDVNYPGSKYSLVYIKEQDVLEGTYFQAVAKETYSVKFMRIPKAQN